MTERRQIAARYDFANDVLTLHNLRYSGELFRVLFRAPVGARFELVAREDGVLTLYQLEINAMSQEPTTPTPEPAPPPEPAPAPSPAPAPAPVPPPSVEP